jgi:DNA adenine methylase
MEGTHLRNVRPISPAAGYIGGKRNLAKALIPLIEAVPHRSYCEPFVGMGGIFLRRPVVPPVEVINDYSRDVATFFRVLQRHFSAFLEMMRFQLTTRAEFERLVKTDPATLTDLERSARFVYLQRLSFGGKVAGRSFGIDPRAPARFNVMRLEPVLEALHERLAGVVIECLPYAEFIRRYDRPEVLFYLDPPYWASEGDYGKDAFSREDFGRLAELLGRIRGRFVLSLNDTPEVRALFGQFFLREAETTYTVAGGAGKRVRELIIHNVPALAGS